MKDSGLLNYDLETGELKEINWENMEKCYATAINKRRNKMKLSQPELAGLVAVLVRDYLIESYLKGDKIETGKMPKM